jgi:glycosyltransferase involved in cell wall biosynthesis
MAIVIFGDLFSFPEGDASTNRVYTYAKGFYENGINVHVICFSNDYIDNHNGITEGIRYYNPFNQKKRSKYFVIRRWQKLLKYFKTIALVRRINKEDNISSIIVYSLLLSTHLFAWYLSKTNKTKLIKECSEHPLIHYQKNAFKKGQGIIKLRIEMHLIDGIFCISRFLIEFFREQGIPQSKLFLIPSTVDPTRFASNDERPFPYRYIGYFGGLTFNRDNIDILLKAFAMICEKNPELHLVLGGFCSEKEKILIENLILDLNISQKVVLLKYLTRKEIIKYIIYADILVMVRSKDLETQASFPCKLTEYLATSKPVITVNVGEISDYLTDGVNSFLVEPGDCNGLAEKLDYVLSNYEIALEIAQQGKLLTSTTFNYNYQAKRLISFIEVL